MSPMGWPEKGRNPGFSKVFPRASGRGERRSRRLFNGEGNGSVDNGRQCNRVRRWVGAALIAANGKRRQVGRLARNCGQERLENDFALRFDGRRANAAFAFVPEADAGGPDAGIILVGGAIEPAGIIVDPIVAKLWRPIDGEGLPRT